MRKTEAEITAAKTAELSEQLRLTTIATQVEFGKEQAEPFFQMRDDFSAMTDCSTVWNIDAERTADKVRERTNADSSIKRRKVSLSLGCCDLIQWDQQVPHFQNANGGDLFLYPGFVIYRAAKKAFSVIDFHDIEPESVKIQFNETEGVPKDSETVGQTWAKVNKDGSRDRRFADNYEIPIALYGQLSFKTTAGLREVFLFSNPHCLSRFVKSWDKFVQSFVNQSFCTVSQQRELEPKDIKIYCPQCDQHMIVSSEDSGREFECTNCGKTLTVPEAI